MSASEAYSNVRKVMHEKCEESPLPQPPANLMFKVQLLVGISLGKIRSRMDGSSKPKATQDSGSKFYPLHKTRCSP